MPERQKLDIVFVVCSNPGNSSKKVDSTISRVSRNLTTSNKDFRIASIHFKQEYNSGARVNLFFSNVSDFSNVYCDAATNAGNPLQYGYPLQHVSNLSFRHDATKICFLLSNVLPFNDSCEQPVIYKNEINSTENNETRQPDNSMNAQKNTSERNHEPEHVSNTRVSHQSNSNIIYHEDPLQSCRIMASMGVVLYCIETIPYCTVYKDMYDALCFVTGGQYLNVHQSQLAKTIKAAILQEVSLKHLVGYVRDYLCIAWLAWGRMKAKKPTNLEELTENVLNYFHKVSITSREVLIDNKPLQPPGKHAKNLTTLKNVAEARKIKKADDNWAAELNWVMPEVCNEVIPGYNPPATTQSSKANIKKVNISTYKRPSRMQVERILIRTLAGRTGMVRRQEQLVEAQKTCNNTDALRTAETNQDNNDAIPVVDIQKYNEVELSKENAEITANDQEVACEPEKNVEGGIHNQQMSVLNCKRELIAEKFTEKCTLVTCKNCIVV